MSHMTDNIPTETHPGLWAKAWKDAQDAHWRKVFKKMLKRAEPDDMLYTRATGFTERIELESRGFTYDSPALSLYNARGNAFNMRIKAEDLRKVLKEMDDARQ